MDDDLKIVEILICGNSYKVACKQNERENILVVANKFAELVNSIVQSNNAKGNDSSIFLIAGLTLLDRTEELTKELNRTMEELSVYKPYFDCYSQDILSTKEIISFTLMRIERLIQYLKKL